MSGILVQCRICAAQTTRRHASNHGLCANCKTIAARIVTAIREETHKAPLCMGCGSSQQVVHELCDVCCRYCDVLDFNEYFSNNINSMGASSAKPAEIDEEEGVVVTRGSNKKKKSKAPPKCPTAENRKAINLVVKDNAESAVKNKRVALPTRLRKRIWMEIMGDRVNGNCYVCGDPLDSFSFEAGHVVAHALGGDNSAENIRPVCSSCNKNMGTQNMEEYKLKYFAQRADAREIPVNGGNGGNGGAESKVVERSKSDADRIKNLEIRLDEMQYIFAKLTEFTNFQARRIDDNSNEIHSLKRMIHDLTITPCESSEEKFLSDADEKDLITKLETKSEAFKKLNKDSRDRLVAIIRKNCPMYAIIMEYSNLAIDILNILSEKKYQIIAKSIHINQSSHEMIYCYIPIKNAPFRRFYSNKYSQSFNCVFQTGRSLNYADTGAIWYRQEFL